MVAFNAVSCLLLILISLPPLASCWIAPLQQSSSLVADQQKSRIHTLLFSSSASDDDDDDDAASAAEPLSLSASDLERLSKLRDRHKTIPIMILDAMLPGQKLEFGVKDARFRELANYLQESGDQLGMIGVDPATRQPLNHGVTVTIDRLLMESNMVTIALEGRERFEVEREPWLDDTKSYYLADVEIIENRSEADLPPDQQEEAQALHNEIPELIAEWLKWLYKTGKATPESMKVRMPAEEMPDEIGARAVWTAGFINPLPPLGVCLEIRPSMLVCRTDLERVRLAHASLKASIDHVSGKRKLF